jgi:hypothetical protein
MPAPIFDKKPEVERKEFRETLRKRIRGAPAPKLSFQDRMQLERKIFGSSAVERIFQDDYKKALRKMERLKFKTRTKATRKAIDDKLMYLLKIGGMGRKDLKSSHKAREVKEVKEEKKDTSIFQPYIKRDAFRQKLKRDEAWRITKMPIKNRIALEKKLFDPKRFGSFIDQREAKIVSKDFKGFPMRVKNKYGIEKKVERDRISKLLEKFLGK